MESKNQVWKRVWKNCTFWSEIVLVWRTEPHEHPNKTSEEYPSPPGYEMIESQWGVYCWVGYKNSTSNKREWNDCFINTSNTEILQDLGGLILQERTESDRLKTQTKKILKYKISHWLIEFRRRSEPSSFDCMENLRIHFLEKAMKYFNTQFYKFELDVGFWVSVM